MNEGLIVVGPDGLVAYLNTAGAYVLGVRAEEALRKPIREVLGLAARDFEAPDAAKALLGLIEKPHDAATSLELVVLRPHRLELAATVFPIPVAARERMTGILLRDVSSERDLERRRDTFVSYASHELRTPVTTISGFTELLLQRFPPEATRREWLERIQRDSRRLAAIVDDMLSVTRIYSGKLAVKLEAVPLRSIVDEALAYIRPTTQSHRFEVAIGPEVPRLAADRDKLAQVLINLLDNAVKYSPQGGQITVSARHKPQQARVVVAVADQGMGIASQHQERLFAAFYRVQRPETEGISGTGLGLAIVKGLVELMQGDLWVESELDNGSTFFFSIPTEQRAMSFGTGMAG